MNTKIGKKTIGNSEKCFVTFELGPTHNGLQTAKSLIEHAKKAGADAVKVQIFDLDRLVSDREIHFQYRYLCRKTKTLKDFSEPLYDILKRRWLPQEEWRQIKQYCDELEIEFFSTIAFEDELDFLIDIGCTSVKIASADVNHLPLLRQAAASGLNIQLDTGMASLQEIQYAVDTIEKEGNQNIIIHHCPSGYPARENGINLRVINSLKERFNYPIAFSDHSAGYDMDIMAIALGVNLVEKTITLDKFTKSVEHAMSLEPNEMIHFVNQIRLAEMAMGDSDRVLSADEIEKRNQIRRSAFTIEDISSGQNVSDFKYEYRRPGHGIQPDEIEKLKDKKFKSDLKAGQIIMPDDIEQI